MRRSRFLVAAVVVAVPLITTACGSSSGPAGADRRSSPGSGTVVIATEGPDGVQQITVDTTDAFRFTPMTIRAHVGELRIVLTDHGSYPHNISFPGLHTTSKTVSGGAGGQTTTLSLTLRHTGIYDFVCTFHSSAGMKGRLTVS